MSKIYLAGPISGLTKDQSDGWRKEFETHLKFGTTIWPMYAEHFAKDLILGDAAATTDLMASPRAVLHKDEFYVRSADIVVANFLGSTKVSIGTVIECAWAIILNKPLVLILTPDNIHRHCMLTEKAGWVLSNVKDAATVCNGLLGAITEGGSGFRKKAA